MMKHRKGLVCLFIALAALTFSGCEPTTDDGSFVEPITLYEKIAGSWTLTDLVMIDEAPDNGWLTNLPGSPNLKKEASPKSELSINKNFGYDSFVLNLNIDEKRQPTTYQVESNARFAFIPTAGYWELSSAFADPKGSSPVITVYSDAAKASELMKITITTSPGAASYMELKVTKSHAGKATISYIYKLTK